MKDAKKHMAAGALIQNAAQEILIVKPNYRDHWLIPGGMVEENESPRAACQREIREELSLELKPVKLLCIDYKQADDSLHFIFEAGTLMAEQIACITLPNEELEAFEFVAAKVALQKLNPFLARRLEHALKAQETGQTFYLENQRYC